MHSAMEQIANQNGRARPILACSRQHWIFPLRKSKYLVYEKGYYRVKKKHYFHARNREPRQEIIIVIWNITPNLHTNSLLKCEPISGLSCRRQVVHPRCQTPQGESVAKPEIPLLIMLSIVCKYEVYDNLFSPFSKSKIRQQNILGRWL